MIKINDDSFRVLQMLLITYDDQKHDKNKTVVVVVVRAVADVM